MGGPSAWEWILYFGLPALLQATIVSVMLSFVIWFVSKKRISRINSSGSESDDIMEIIRRRYAKGEISRREYEQLREDLEISSLDGETSEAQKEGAR